MQQLDGRFFKENNFKNKIINGGFDVWQRGTSKTLSSAEYLADRWNTNPSGGSITTSRQEFSIGQTDVLGSPRYYMKHNCTVGDNFSGVVQRVENPKLFSGKTYTLSFYYSLIGKTLNLRTMVNTLTDGTTQISNGNNIAESASWSYYELTFTVQDLSALTFDENSYLGIVFEQDKTDVTTTPYILNLAQVQLEEGSVATEFEQRPLSIEEMLCYRYYCKSEASFYSSDSLVSVRGISTIPSGTDGANFQADRAFPYVQFPTQMRTAPTFTFYPGKTNNVITPNKISIYNNSTTSTFTSNFDITSTRISGYFANISPSSLTGTYLFHYTADAEL